MFFDGRSKGKGDKQNQRQNVNGSADETETLRSMKASVNEDEA